ncbi:hypothetical protein VSU19_15975 [Verrucomicrobiales bacterium BCK34]|nr:hypothetical protein [Verrucomicrobiales bacterium BCK34]
MIFSRFLILSAFIGLLISTALPATTSAQDEPAVDTNPPTSRERSFVKIREQEIKPTVRAIAPMDDNNVFFLNRRGQIGAAKFSPGLSQIGWELYSHVKLNALTALTIGPNYSIITASPTELTQGFDTDADGTLDFFQAIVTDWPGRSEGVTITAGPVTHPNGKVLFALSPHAAEEGATPLARLVAWSPKAPDAAAAEAGASALEVVTESNLAIGAFAINDSGLLASRLLMPDYEDGYYVSLTELPAPAAEGQPVQIPRTLPSLLIPAELTKKAPPTQLNFFREHGSEKLLLTCPESNQLIEIEPTKTGASWEGSILVRAIAKEPIMTLIDMGKGQLLAGGDNGFIPMETSKDVFRIARVSLAEDGIALDFTAPVDRFTAVKPDSYSVRAFSLQGGESSLVVQPVIESDGRSVILKTPNLKAQTVLRVVCQNVPSEDGRKLLSTAVSYTIHER